MPSKKVMYISIHAPLTGSDPVQPGLRSGISISIHAPLTGSDYGRRVELCLIDAFQSTLPSQGATQKGTGGNRISGISIHAPLTGSDPETSHSTHTLRNFNPRSPHRERPLNFPVFNSTQHFNPRSPHRERPGSVIFIRIKKQFQSTLPSQGATRIKDA